MASGVGISDEVVTLYEKIRVRYQGSEEQERFKLLVMRMSEDQKTIIIDHNASLKVKDFKNEEDVFKKVISMLPETDCRYAVYDCTYENYESPKEELVFIMWAVDGAPLKSKMLYASSKSALMKKLPGLKRVWQVNDHSDKDVSALVEQLGGRKVVKTLEGKCI